MTDKQKLEKIYTIVNNYLYFKDMKTRNFYNMIWEIYEVFKVEDNNFGEKYIEESK